jgi:glycosyltransferase involved in cell wall biosynthesis
MESFACGCPVVASAVGGVPDIMLLTGAGLTVPPANPDALARSLQEALARGWDRREIAQAMDGYTIADTARRYLKVCQDAAQARVPT